MADLQWTKNQILCKSGAALIKRKIKELAMAADDEQAAELLKRIRTIEKELFEFQEKHFNK